MNLKWYETKKRFYIYFQLRCEKTIEVRVNQLQDKKLKFSNEILTGSAQNSIKINSNDIKMLLDMR